MVDPVSKPSPAPAPVTKRKLRYLRIVWDFTRRYPLQLAGALVALLIAAAATLWIPRTFQLVVDHGFAAGADSDRIGVYFRQLLAVVLVLAVATAGRFYFVSWLAERTVADIRTALQQSMDNNAAVFRTEETLKQALTDIHALKERYSRITVQDKGKRYNSDLLEAIELGFLLELAEVTVVCALIR